MTGTRATPSSSLRHPPLGYSSGTLPGAGPEELARAVLGAGGTGVDLRIGKGHGWERDGVRPGIDRILRTGADVFFVGVGWHLGDPARWPVGEEAVPAEYPVKVFCVQRPDPALVTEQLAAAAEAGLRPWVETHAGGPDTAGLIDLADRTGVGVLVDLLGLAEIGGADRAQLRALAPFVRAAQVKGVLRTPQGTRHRPLAPHDLSDLSYLLGLGPLHAVTVESRAGTPDADLAVLAAELASPAAERAPGATESASPAAERAPRSTESASPAGSGTPRRAAPADTGPDTTRPPLPGAIRPGTPSGRQPAAPTYPTEPGAAHS
ncbi:hypothetical protein [Streptomyces sp. NPDC013455]|uniref:hypothetical protein n=1 Tax=Streptomyces sp. NPDC013455 TaxID=3155605 RepID=UPI0033FAA42B